MVDYNESLLNNLIEYNKKRYLAFKEQIPFEYDCQFEKLLNARIQKVGRIKKRLLYLLDTNIFGFVLLHFQINILINRKEPKEI